MGIALIVLLVVICVIVNKKSKQKKIEKKKQLFNDVILKTVEWYSEKRERFEDIYDVYMEDVISEEKDQLFNTDISELKERYKKTLGELVSISENNSVFFTTEEEWEGIDFLERDEKASKDIIQSIPYLIDFIEAYNELVSGLFQYLKDITTMYDYVWSALKYSPDEDDSEYYRETMEKRFQSSCQTAMHCYRTFIESDAWDVIKKQYPQWSSKVDHDTFIGVAENNTEAINQWFDLWYDQFKAIDEDYNYGPTFSRLVHFLNDTNEEFGDPEWFSCPTLEFKLGFESAMPLLNAKKVNREVLTEIRNQYIEGKLKGKYHQSFDPDEDEDDED